MIPRSFLLLVDSETVQSGKIFDFCYQVIQKSYPFAVVHSGNWIVKDFCTEQLFSIEKSTVFSRASVARRTEAYRQMVRDGLRIVASVDNININLKYIVEMWDPEVMAYNVSFDISAMKKTGLFTGFKSSRCLMQNCISLFLDRKGYRSFALKYGAFTDKGILSFNAQNMYRYIFNEPDFIESHTAAHDVEIERAIYCYVARQKKSLKVKKIDFKKLKYSVIYNQIH